MRIISSKTGPEGFRLGTLNVTLAPDGVFPPDALARAREEVLCPPGQVNYLARLQKLYMQLEALVKKDDRAKQEDLAARLKIFEDAVKESKLGWEEAAKGIGLISAQYLRQNLEQMGDIGRLAMAQREVETLQRGDKTTEKNIFGLLREARAPFLVIENHAKPYGLIRVKPRFRGLMQLLRRDVAKAWWRGALMFGKCTNPPDDHSFRGMPRFSLTQRDTQARILQPIESAIARKKLKLRIRAPRRQIRPDADGVTRLFELVR